MSGPTTIECACDYCRGMCSSSVCIPTPDEARELIRRGYASRLGRYEFNPRGPSPGESVVAPQTRGRAGETLPTTTEGGCVFHMADGRCELHAPGLKPLEGRLACHDRAPTPIRLHVLRKWAGQRYQSVSTALQKACA